MDNTSLLLNAERAALSLVSVLHRYGGHTHFCEMVRAQPRKPEACDCGWADVLRRLGMFGSANEHAHRPEPEPRSYISADDAWYMIE